MWKRLDCIFRGILRTIKSFIKTGEPTIVCGCNYVEDETIKNVTITILRCEDCGGCSVGWEK